ncbi:MAG: hypothetical protein HKN70_13325 [Gammaproteobacteria bacterium]|nr:hypothetical protein [Gammaproteobacteria bacterium]
MKHSFNRRTLFKLFGWPGAVTLLVPFQGCALGIHEEPLPQGTFSERCSAPGVIRCFGFEQDELASNGGPIVWGRHDARVGTFVNGMRPGRRLDGRIEIANDFTASGASSLKFFMPSRSNGGHAGQFYANFSDDLSVQLSEGDEFFIQWRQRFSTSFLDNRYRPYNSWKQMIVGEGDRPGKLVSSCTQLEVVVTNKGTRPASPSVYHSCRGKDGDSEGIDVWRTFPFVAEQWMTFQLHVKIGTWYKNDRRYHHDSLIELWVARENEPSRKILSQNYDLANNNVNAAYGKVWLLPYLGGKDASQEHPDAFTWYDDLIISRTAIADPVRR